VCGCGKGRREQTNLVLQETGAKPQLVNWSGPDRVSKVMPAYGREGLGPLFFWKGISRPRSYQSSYKPISLGGVGTWRAP